MLIYATFTSDVDWLTCCCEGLSVYPTWLAVRDHVPVEHGEPDSSFQSEETSGRMKVSADIERGS